MRIVLFLVTLLGSTLAYGSVEMKVSKEAIDFDETVDVRLQFDLPEGYRIDPQELVKGVREPVDGVVPFEVVGIGNEDNEYLITLRPWSSGKHTVSFGVVRAIRSNGDELLLATPIGEIAVAEWPSDQRFPLRGKLLPYPGQERLSVLAKTWGCSGREK